MTEQKNKPMQLPVFRLTQADEDLLVTIEKDLDRFMEDSVTFKKVIAHALALKLDETKGMDYLDDLLLLSNIGERRERFQEFIDITSPIGMATYA